MYLDVLNDQLVLSAFVTQKKLKNFLGKELGIDLCLNSSDSMRIYVTDFKELKFVVDNH